MHGIQIIRFANFCFKMNLERKIIGEIFFSFHTERIFSIEDTYRKCNLSTQQFFPILPKIYFSFIREINPRIRMDTDLSFVHSNFPIRYFYISRLVRSVAKSSFGIQIRADLFPFIFPFAPLVEQFFRKRRIKYETISLRGELLSRFNK